MSGTFPSSPIFEEMKIRSMAFNEKSYGHDMTRQVRSRAVHRWHITGKLPRMTRAEAMPIFAFLVAQRGTFETFSLVLPELSNARGSAPGTPLVNGAGQTGRSINTDGWTASQSGILLAGDLVKFNGHNKVYMITSDASSDGSSESTISIEPALAEAIADNEALTVNSVPFTVACLNDVEELTVTSIMYGISLEFEEVPQ